ncbi:hypothetical protein [Actinomarinicola tropica]|uniref:Uncharacterized protein n=1 Tax=Actinomarinicola tropica TaxID=2789776 RepID=A0A5Q2RU53_9ACTN|nr:hypothetical protein [Actinomarinicola tropica]QGG96745.1 hypothetical protein GH723_17500 [Actinomarinicola tropica]
MAHDHGDASASGDGLRLRSLWLGGVAVIAFGLGFLTARSLDGDPSGSWDPAPDLDLTLPEGSVSLAPGHDVVDLFDSPMQPDELPEVKLVVHTDGCGVIRPEIADPPHGLTWSVRDLDGFRVLGRNALSDTRYRYFRPGTYTVVLEAWDGEKYAAISNVVTISC